jgi:predicted Zn-dependent protease
MAKDSGSTASSPTGCGSTPSTQHVPLILAGAGVEPSVVTQPASLVDVLPTVLGAVGVAVPKDIDGKAVPGDPHPVYVESYQVRDRFGLAPQVGVIEGSDELIDVPDPELIDVAADPLGEKNRASAEPDRVIALRKQLLAFGFTAPPAPSADPATAGALAALGYVEGTFDGDLSGPLPDAKPARPWITQSQRADRLRGEGKVQDAAKILEQLVAAHPDVLEFRARLANLWLTSGDPRRAEPLMEEVLARDPRNAAMRTAKAAFLARRGDLETASTLFQELAKEQPYSPSLRAMAVAALLDVPEKRDDGVALAEQYLKDDPDDRAVAGVLGVHWFKTARFDKAVPLLVLGAKATRPQPQVCFALASLERGRDHAKEALDLLEREFQSYPRNRAAGLAFLQEASEQKDWTRTVAAAEQLIRLDPKDPVLWHARAQALFNLGRYAEARTALEEGRKQFPTSAALWLLDANLLAKEGKRDLAQASFEKATQLRKAEVEAVKPVPEPTWSRPWEPDQEPVSRPEPPP